MHLVRPEGSYCGLTRRVDATKTCQDVLSSTLEVNGVANLPCYGRNDNKTSLTGRFIVWWNRANLQSTQLLCKSSKYSSMTIKFINARFLFAFTAYPVFREPRLVYTERVMKAKKREFSIFSWISLAEKEPMKMCQWAGQRELWTRWRFFWRRAKLQISRQIFVDTVAVLDEPARCALGCGKPSSESADVPWGGFHSRRERKLQTNWRCVLDPAALFFDCVQVFFGWVAY